MLAKGHKGPHPGCKYREEVLQKTNSVTHIFPQLDSLTSHMGSIMVSVCFSDKERTGK